MQTLHPFQAETTQVLLPAAFKAKHTRVCLYGPCGSGKTTMIADICRGAASKGNTVTVTAHRRRLIKQLSERLGEWGVRYHNEMANAPDEPWFKNDPGAEIIIGSRDTMLKLIRVPAGVRPSKIWIPDEAHCITGQGYKELGDAISFEYLIGPTATPCDENGSGLGKNLFTELVWSTRIEHLIRDGYLTKMDSFAPVGADKRRREGLKQGVYGDPVGQWVKHASGMRTVTFCRTIKECQAVRLMFLADMIPAEHISAETPDDERDDTIERLRTGDLKVLVCTPGLLGVGVDIPELECVQTLVKNISPRAFWQTVGRGQRTAEGKKRCVLLDHAGAVFEHGLPNASPPWELSDRESVQVRTIRKMSEDKSLRPVVCPNCGSISTGGTCPGCNIATARPGRKVQTTRENLDQVDEIEPMDRYQIEWLRILWQCGYRGEKCVVAFRRFMTKFGIWPCDAPAALDPKPSWSSRVMRVDEKWPKFARKK